MSLTADRMFHHPAAVDRTAGGVVTIPTPHGLQNN